MTSDNELSLARLGAVGLVLVVVGTWGYVSDSLLLLQLLIAQPDSIGGSNNSQYSIDGLIDVPSQGGSHLVNSFYCAVITLTT